MSRVILFVTSFILISFSEFFSQGDINFNHINVGQGLSQSSVTCILQDQSGFMWFGTQDGLNRFDGYKFKVFKNNPADSTSLKDNFIFSIYEDHKGTLYFETERGSFHKFDPLTESFIVMDKEKIDLTKARMNTVGASLTEPNGIKWVGGAGKGTGLERIDTKTGNKTIFKHKPNDPSSLISDKVYSIFRDSKKNLWVGTFEGLDRLDEKTGKFIHYRHDPSNPNSIPDNWVWPITEDSRGNLWIGTVQGGISRYNPSTNTFTNYQNDPDDPRSINDNFIFNIFEDRSGIIWIGTNTGGVNYFHPSSQVFERYMNLPGNNNSLSDNSVMAIHADRQGNYWISTRNGGLDKFNYDNKSFTNYRHDPNDPNSLINNPILTIEEDNTGVLWLGTFSGGMNSFDPQRGIVKRYLNNPSDPNTISDNRVYSIMESKSGFIWIGTYGGGLNKLDRGTGKIEIFRNDPEDTSSISSNSVWSIQEDETGKIWLGTFGGGVNVFDPVKGTFTKFKNDPDNPASLGDDNIIRVFKDNENDFWFGTTKGLCRYIRSENRFKTYREIDGLPNDFVFGILQDKAGYMWLSTNNGLSRFDPRSETFQNYFYDDGLQGNEFNQNAFAKDKKSGRLLFGGPNGLNIFDPSKLKANTFVPPVVFTRYLRYNTDDAEGKPIIEKGIPVRDSILLTFKDNIITLEFAALNYLNASENQYRYKLEGFNENWIQLGSNHEVTFTNLSPGEYNLRVIGSNNDGLWNEEGASLFIEVLPPWWRTNIAYAIYAILFLSILYGLRKVELDKREQKARIRETELRMKATEAEKRAIEIENERKTKELEEARELQLSMLPKELPKLPDMEIAAFMRTATEVGGDYYDFRQDNGKLFVAFGDATGHGLQAGTMVTLMKGFFTSDSSKLELREFMSHCTNMIKEIKLGRILMSFSLLKIENRKLQLTSAGMPPMYYYSSEKQEIEEIIVQGMPLGAMRKFSYKIFERDIRDGDILLLLTDGLPEQMNKDEQMYDYTRVREQFKSGINSTPEQIIQNLIKSGDEWMEGTVQADDMSFVVIKFN